MKRIIISVIIILAVVSMTIKATTAYFSDTEASSGNTFSTGTLNLTLDGANTNIAKFNVSGMKPNDIQTGTWTIRNTGSIDGYLDMHNIVQTHSPGTTTEPELTIEDPDVGSLGDLLNINLFVDANNNGVLDNGETTIYSGLLSGLANTYDANIPLSAGSTNYITMAVNWPSGPNDNKGQGDVAQLDMTFELGQTTIQ